MKNQYLCDIGDYGKYSMLRAIADSGVAIGVNWYLTGQDDTNDGKHKGYLDKDEMGVYDIDVFNCLKKIRATSHIPSVRDIRNCGIIPRAVFFDEELKYPTDPKERKEYRSAWFERSMRILNKSELVFMDPDNGLLVNGKETRKGAEKYVLPDEVIKYYENGQDVVYYCQRGRRKDDAWQKYLNTIPEQIPLAGVIHLTYHKGTQRSYIFILHNTSYWHYDTVLRTFAHIRWNGIFTVDYLKPAIDDENNHEYADPL